MLVCLTVRFVFTMAWLWLQVIAFNIFRPIVVDRIVWRSVTAIFIFRHLTTSRTKPLAINITLRRRCRHTANSAEHNIVIWSTNDAAAVRCRYLENVTKHNVLFYSAPLAPLYENVTSFIKPEVHNVLHCWHKRTEPCP